MAAKTYQAGVKEYRQTYWTPDYVPLDSDIPACFKISPQPGVDREEAAAAVAAESSTGTWTTVWTDLLTDLDYYKGRAYRIEDVPGDDTCFYPFVAYPIDLFEEGSVVNVFTSLVGNVFGFKAPNRIAAGCAAIRPPQLQAKVAVMANVELRAGTGEIMSNESGTCKHVSRHRLHRRRSLPVGLQAQAKARPPGRRHRGAGWASAAPTWPADESRIWQAIGGAEFVGRQCGAAGAPSRPVARGPAGSRGTGGPLAKVAGDEPGSCQAIAGRDAVPARTSRAAVAGDPAR